MRGRLNALLRRLGTAGVLALGVLLACAGFWWSALSPLEQGTATQRAALERLRAHTPVQPVGTSRRAEELRRFYGLFPLSAELPAELERVHRLARSAGLELAQGEYRLDRRPTGLWAYRLTLPVRGSYPQLREFLGALLKELPIASIDALRFERKKAADAQLEAQLRLTLYVRPPGDTP
jgi:Tfp pilus assembly protein PilO